IPALLYYVGLFMQVDSYAARHGLKGLPRSELPSAWESIKDGWYYAFVIVLLIVMLLYFKRESHAPFYATALLLVLNQWAQPGAWRTRSTAWSRWRPPWRWFCSVTAMPRRSACRQARRAVPPSMRG